MRYPPVTPCRPVDRRVTGGLPDAGCRTVRVRELAAASRPAEAANRRGTMTPQLTGALRRSILTVATCASVGPGDPADQSRGVAVLKGESCVGCLSPRSWALLLWGL